MGRASAFVRGMVEPGHIHAHIEQDVDGNGYVWTVSTMRDIWMGVTQSEDEARAVVNVHLKGIILTRRHRA